MKTLKVKEDCKTYFLGKKTHLKYILAIGVLTVLMIVSVFYCFILCKNENNPEPFYSAVASFISMNFSVILFISCYLGGYYKTKKDVLFSSSVFALSVLFFVVLMIAYINGTNGSVKLEYILNYFVSIFCVLTFSLFWYYQLEVIPKSRFGKNLTLVIWFLFIFYTILYVLNLKTGIMLRINSDNKIEFTGLIIEVTVILCYEFLYVINILYAKIKLKKKIVMLSYAFFPVLCAVFNYIFLALDGELFIYSSSYSFILMACYIIFFNTFIEEKEQMLVKDKQLAENEKERIEMQTSVMLSQIQPHFLYNALTAIRVLCRNDPERGDEAIVRFSQYLRANMDSLNSAMPIRFEKELEHTKTYLMIEQMRFGDDLRIEYDIGYSDFMIPPLTLQPIVENAVRHGICSNENGGTVVIRTEKIQDEIHISVTDDGAGFDIMKVPSDGNDHIGLENVKTRLNTMVGGDLIIDSAVGSGTTVRIILRGENK